MLATDLTPGLMTVAFVGSGKFIKERPEVAERFVVALTEAARLMQGDNYLSKENLDAYMKFTASTEAALKAAQPAVYDPNRRSRSKAWRTSSESIARTAAPITTSRST